MKILVTGGMGFIGSAVIRYALRQGHSIVNLDGLTYAANPKTLASLENNQYYEFIKADICDENAVKSVFSKYRPNAVMHLAAESHVDRSIEAPGAFIQTNVIGTYNMLHYARAYWDSLKGENRQNFRFHHVSTDEVFGDLSQDESAFCETTPYDPSSPYSASKAASDHLVRAWGRTYGLPVVLSNCSNNYGPFQFPEKLIPVVILKALYKEEIPVYGTGENIRDWLYVDDHADALLTVLQKGKLNETYNIGAENECTNLKIVEKVCVIMDELCQPSKKSHKKLITFVEDRPGHDVRYALNVNKIYDDLGWRACTQFDKGLEKTINWYLNNKDWWAPLIQKEEITNRRGLISTIL
ncbi:MAG: dTDP-glucose 4,6-dehydratase [Robiginitomaculum sp.]